MPVRILYEVIKTIKFLLRHVLLVNWACIIGVDDVACMTKTKGM